MHITHLCNVYYNYMYMFCTCLNRNASTSDNSTTHTAHIKEHGTVFQDSKNQRVVLGVVVVGSWERDIQVLL